MADALDYAHGKGIVHRDVKPQNVLLDEDGRVYLADFGIAKMLEASGGLTATGMITGTPNYMAPEQFLQHPVNAATDVYALGVVLFEMLVGQKPFRPTESSTSGHSKTSRELLEEAHLKMEPPDPAQLRPEIPQAVSQVILKCLNKESRQRFQSTAELFSALCLACGVREERVKDRVTPIYLGSTTDAIPNPKPPLPPPSNNSVKHGETAQTRRPPVWFMVLGGLAVAGVITFLLISSSKPSINPSVISQDPSLSLNQQTTENNEITKQNTPEQNMEPTKSQGLITPTKTPTRSSSTSRVGSDGMRMIYIAPGEFMMGSRNCSSGRPYECPSRSVYLDGFWIDETEVTNEMYRACVSDGYCDPPRTSSSASRSYYYGNSQYNDYPVIYVNWYQAQDYCVYAGKRLPTEAEWEKAARGNLEYSYPWGDMFQCDFGNFDDDRVFDSDFVPGGPDCDGFADTSPVGAYTEGGSKYNVLDLAGNVWEWVRDYYGYYDQSDDYNPIGPSSGNEVVLRGGSWTNDMDLARTTFRAHNEKSFVNNDIGFRCADDE